MTELYQENWLIYGLLIFTFFAIYYLKKSNQERKSRVRKSEEIDAGLIEPPSLHPVIDPNKCLGCSACVKACPEGGVIGILNGKAELIAPTHCIGHGACKKACPFDAIELVFGTEKRGVDIPYVDKNFETNVPGIFIAGELGGMGLIRNAVEQGKQALNYIIDKHIGQKIDGVLDVLIVGAGPAGFSASLAALEKNLNFVTLEQETFGGTVAHYPRGKVVMTQPVKLPIYGNANFKETTKEKLLEFWQVVRDTTNLKIHYGERVVAVEQGDDVFEITTETKSYQTKSLLLAVGRRGTPRKLDVPGEDHKKVVYNLIDPLQYAGQHILIVGGGDSALEAADAISQVQGTTVSLSYRSEAFGRAKQKNREKIDVAQNDGRLKLMMPSTVKKIEAGFVTLEQNGDEITLQNDGVIICAGGILPSAFLREVGIDVETKYGSA